MCHTFWDICSANPYSQMLASTNPSVWCFKHVLDWNWTLLITTCHGKSMWRNKLRFKATFCTVSLYLLYVYWRKNRCTTELTAYLWLYWGDVSCPPCSATVHWHCVRQSTIFIHSFRLIIIFFMYFWTLLSDPKCLLMVVTYNSLSCLTLLSHQLILNLNQHCYKPADQNNSNKNLWWFIIWNSCLDGTRLNSTNGDPNVHYGNKIPIMLCVKSCILKSCDYILYLWELPDQNTEFPLHQERHKLHQISPEPLIYPE